MIGHQRNILAQLGIDLWVPRSAACEIMPPQSLWREQDVQTPEVSLPVQHLTEAPSISDQKETELGLNVETATPESEPLSTVAAFQLQVLNLADYLLVVDALHLDTPQRQLWANIKEALGAEYLSLDWPLAFENFQDPQGQPMYLKGFFDMIGHQKICLCLGELSYLPINTEILPSLAELLQQPQLKQQLWQRIQRIHHEKSGGV